MTSLYFYLGLIVVTVCLQLVSTEQPTVKTKRDFASIPGHLEALGAKSIKHSLEVIQSYPDPETFFKTYVVPSRPVLIQNGAKMSSAFEKWTDEYFLSFPESNEHKIEAEQRKKEKRTVPSEEISFSEFVKTYDEKDIYMVSSVPTFIRRFGNAAFFRVQNYIELYCTLKKAALPKRRSDVLLPSPLLCRDITETGMLTDAVMWFSSGGTKSVLHLDDGLDNINCLFRGTKELLFIDYHKYKHVVPIDFPAEGYSGVDVDRVDFEKYPGLINVEYYNVTMQAGDCLFIPHRWFHQVRSYGRNLAVNLWWSHRPKFVPQDCEGVEPNQTLDKFKFTSLKELMENRTRDEMLNLLQRFLRKKDEISYKIFVKRLRKDPQLFNNDETEWNKEMKLAARKMFKLMDVDGDKYFSISDLEELEKDDAGESTAILNEYYRLADLIELEREYNDEEEEEGEDDHDDGAGDGDDDIEPVGNADDKNTREEL